MFGLDEAPKYRLARPPLVQALGQVRFPVRAKIPTLEGVAPIQDRLNSIFPYMREQRSQQVSLLVGPTGSASAQSQPEQIWQFNDDHGWTLTLSANTATVGAGSNYGEFKEFSNRFREVVAALAEDAGVTRVDRIGLRYINVADVLPENIRSWHEWFQHDLTGWVTTEVVNGRAKLLTSITQSHFSSQEFSSGRRSEYPLQGIVRHGFVPANTMVPSVLPVQPQGPAFLLDIDMFIETTQLFDAGELSNQLTMLHDEIDRFFFWAISPLGAKHFGLEVL